MRASFHVSVGACEAEGGDPNKLLTRSKRLARIAETKLGRMGVFASNTFFWFSVLLRITKISVPAKLSAGKSTLSMISGERPNQLQNLEEKSFTPKLFFTTTKVGLGVAFDSERTTRFRLRLPSNTMMWLLRLFAGFCPAANRPDTLSKNQLKGTAKPNTCP